MKTDVAGRVRNTPLAASKPLMPLYEAVVNSIQAIQEAQEQSGKIVITVIRDENHLLKEQDASLGEITGFEVCDNGVGFNDENYRAFETSDTTYKANRGGKGIGRFLWLVAFDRIEIISHFKVNGKLQCRKLGFTPDGDGVKDMTVGDSQEIACSTTVRLMGFKSKFQQQCPKKLETIGTHLIEHCLEFFIRGDCPDIKLKDNNASELLDLNEKFGQEMAERSTRQTVNVDGNDFHVLHVRLRSSHVSDHLLHFCADSRVVKSEKLLSKLPNLARRIQDQSGQDFVYAAYVDGRVLNDSVNAQRTDFAIDENNDELLVKAVNWQAIRDGVFESCRTFLKPYTDPIRDQKQKRVEKFVATDGPMYRPILKYVADKIDMIDPDTSDDALDIRLYQAYHDLQVQLRTQGSQLLQQEVKEQGWEEFYKQLEDYFEKVSDINKSDLARYVCHRRAVLDFLGKQLGTNEDGSYRREDRIHQIIFPLRKTSNDVLFDDHNLWLIDERLVYHAFLASDKPLRSNSEVSTDSRKEPDILVFDKTCAFVTGNDLPYSGITLIEFKRPMRNDYKPDDNPFVQVRQYLTDIREGKARTPDGRNIPVGNDVPFQCYIICDITPTLEKYAYDFELEKTPDGQGFIGYKKSYRAYVEVISYTKMLTDAKKRNAAFFAKLALPTQIG
jgi:hypothetical protein